MKTPRRIAHDKAARSPSRLANWAAVASSGALFLCLVVGAAPARADFFPGESVDGPSAAIQQLSGLSLSHDGTGGLVEIKQDGGANHIFVSRLVNGGFLTPERIDPALPGDSSQPTIASGDGGELQVAFINSGILYVVSRTAGATSWPAPIPLMSGASDPSIALSVHDKGYLAFTAQGSGGHDIRIARWRNARWLVLPAALDAHLEDDAGTGTARPSVAAAGDGQAVVAWGEGGQIFVRRVWDVNPSVVFAAASLPDLEGHPGGAADLPSVGVGDDSSFALVTFRQQFAQGAGTFARAIGRRLRGSAFDDPVTEDGLAFPVGEDANTPVQGMDNHAAALVATTLSTSHQTWGASAADDALLNGPARLDAAPSGSDAQPAAALGRDDAGLIAWQFDQGLLGSQVLVRPWDGQGFGPQASITNPALGPTNAAAGLFAGADRVGDVAVAFVQGPDTARRIVVGGFDKPPAVFGATTTQQWTRRAQPTLSWGQPTDLWGGIAKYAVSLDGQPLGTTTLTHLVPPRIPDGEHHWQVVAIDRHNQQTAATVQRLRIDTTPPTLTLRITGTRKAKRTVRFAVRVVDAPPALPPGAAPPAVAVVTSGARTVRIDFGDRSPRAKGTRATHHYKRGKYRVKVTVIDPAGNVAVATQKLRIGR